MSPVGALAHGGAAAWVAAVLIWPVVSMLPGYLVVTALEPNRRTIERWAVAPLVSIALLFVPAVWVDLVRPGWGLAVAAVALVLSSVASLMVLRRRGVALLGMPRPFPRPLAALVVIMVLACALGAAVVLRSPGGLDTVVPNDDGNGHGWFVTRILLTGSVDPSTVTTLDPLVAHGGGFYPLGLHLLAALASAASSVPAALVVVGVLASAVWAPLAVFALARRLAGPVVGVVAAGLLALATPWFPYAQMAWGGWTLIVAVALVPAAVLVVLDLRGPRGLPVAVLAVAGLLVEHVSEVVVVGIVVALTVLLDRARRTDLLPRVGWLVVAGAVAGVAAVPMLRGIGAAAAVGQVDSTQMGALEALREVVRKPLFGFEGPEPVAAVLLTLWGVVSLILVLGGSVLLWRRPTARGVVLSGWLFVVLAFLAYTGRAGLLTLPWYGSGNRLLVQATALAVIPTAAAVVALVPRVRRSGGALTSVVVVGAVVVGFMLVARTVQAGDTSLRRALVTSDHVAAFRWLDANSVPGERVLNDPRAGTVWLYESTAGAVAPVFGPKHDWRADPVWSGRVYLQDHLTDVATDPRVREEAAAAHVRYVLVAPAVVPGGTPTLDPAAIAATPALREVFRSGDVRVYELPR
jgi:hypothetical protein